LILKLEYRDLINTYYENTQIRAVSERIAVGLGHITINPGIGSFSSFIAFFVLSSIKKNAVFVLESKERAAYFLNDLESLINAEKGVPYKPHLCFFPRSARLTYEHGETDNHEVQLRAETINAIHNARKSVWIVTYPEALSEKVVTAKALSENTFRLRTGDKVDLDFLLEFLIELGFERTDYVYEPGQFSIRGGITDIFSFSNEKPYRIELVDDMVESIREFNPLTQLSLRAASNIAIMPNVQEIEGTQTKVGFPEILPKGSVVWMSNYELTLDKLDKAAEAIADKEPNEADNPRHYINSQEFKVGLEKLVIIEESSSITNMENHFSFQLSPQPAFNKDFNLFLANLNELANKGYHCFLHFNAKKQAERMQQIIEDIRPIHSGQPSLYTPVYFPIYEGFIDHQQKLACYTDHQVFGRYHKFKLRDGYENRENVTLKDILELKPGDYVTHIDHGVGRFDGLESMEVNGKMQEAVRLIYKDGDILYVSIHSLHRIAKYSGKEGNVPTLHRLGSNVWKNLKEKTKKRVKEIAIDLLRLYSKRKTAEGFAFSPDTYMQTELEASFIYEDTPDQEKSTIDVKTDMEKPNPMDRLICGDVGFGKTEIAIRAAFKAVSDSKQVAILVPTTILALQHYQTFSERLKGFPCNISYINRFRSAKNIKETLKELKEGKLDIIIGTHRLLSKDVEYKDLGLLIIDEEQKFGVAAKEQLREFRESVDTLTLTATPIPRTLQFSLMGARDLSVIKTPPANRYPIKTELCPFSETTIKDAILYELQRDGQVFFIHNRVQNIKDIADLIKKLCPGAKVTVGHGQMEGADLEKVMLEFIAGKFDVLVATTIIESGLDIPNANTIIINDAQNFGLSDLHQMRGRVGRTNKQAFCYLLSPPISVLTEEARKRLKAIAEFSDLGSGFNIALRDLDIRGAGNLLGGEQSGFINEMGMETYLKILQEAIEELKQSSENKDLLVAESPYFVEECAIESDLGIFFPSDYVPDSSQRIILYKNLSEVKNEEELGSFQDALIDRFGPIPEQVQELMISIRLRWLARNLGMEKLVFKNDMLLAYFISNPDSSFYKSATFGNIIEYIKSHPTTCKIREQKEKLYLSIESVKSIRHAYNLFRKLSADNDT